MPLVKIPFKDFWDAYALKLDRRRAERAWERLSARDRRAALDGIPSYREACRRRGISMMYAQGYLNNRRWEDEAETPPAADVRPEPVQTSLFDDDALDGMEVW